MRRSPAPRPRLVPSPGLWVVLVGLIAVGCAPRREAGGQVRPEVPFVSSPLSLVEVMLTLTRVSPEDTVFDLGSGDGRIVILAASLFGASGVGIDIDPERVREATENARTMGVSDRVRFVVGDLFGADISPATVVTLYLSPEVNRRLRPKLLRELRPGTRIVSHDYDLADWPPERTIKYRLFDGEHTLHFWTVPGGAGGRRSMRRAFRPSSGDEGRHDLLDMFFWTGQSYGRPLVLSVFRCPQEATVRLVRNGHSHSAVASGAVATGPRHMGVPRPGIARPAVRWASVFTEGDRRPIPPSERAP